MTSVAQHPTPSRRGLAGRLPSPGFETFGGIFGFVYTFLAGNVLLALANAPLVLCLALVADPIAAWPFFLALSVTVPPSLAGLFASFQALNDDGAAVKPVASFLRGYFGGFRRAAPLGLAAVAVLLFLGVDLAVSLSMPAAAVLVPIIVVAAAVTVAVTVTTSAGVVLLPEAGLKDLLKAALLPVRAVLVPEHCSACPAGHHRLCRAAAAGAGRGPGAGPAALCCVEQLGLRVPRSAADSLAADFPIAGAGSSRYN